MQLLSLLLGYSNLMRKLLASRGSVLSLSDVERDGAALDIECPRKVPISEDRKEFILIRKERRIHLSLLQYKNSE